MRPPEDHRAHRRGSTVLAVAVAVAALLTGCATGSHVDDDRHAEVAERGRSVMPFDLDRTTHRFAKTGTGGVQTVVADDPGDTAQIALVREHLRDEAGRFRRGDFTDPARIHGDDMPGLAALRDGADRVTVTYAPTPDGARITYATADRALVTALHAWFDAQVTDHGPDAEHG